MISFFIEDSNGSSSAIGATVKKGTTWLEFAKRLREEGVVKMFPNATNHSVSLEIYEMVRKVDLDNIGAEVEMRTRW